MPNITARQFPYASQRSSRLLSISFASAVLLAGCGGNGDVSLPEIPAAAKNAVSTIEGAWIGNITVNELPTIVAPSSTAQGVATIPTAIPVPMNYAVATLILGDGTSWSLYGQLPGASSGFTLQGFHHAASGSLSGLNYNSTNLNWYSGYSKQYAGTMDAKATPLGTFNATGTPASAQPPQLQSFSISAAPFDPAVYDYNKAATLADIADVAGRKWSGNLVGGGTPQNYFTGFSIDKDGGVTGTLNFGTAPSCSFTGTATPHATKNYFNVSVTTGDAMACPQLSGATLTGIMIKVRVRVANLPEWDQLLGGLTSSNGSTGGVFYSSNYTLN